MKRYWGAVCLMVSLGVCPGAALAASRVDLEIDTIRIQPERPVSDVPVTAVVSLRNSGSEAAEGFDVAVTLLRDGRKIKTITELPVLSRLPRQGTGQSMPLALGLLPPGEYEVLARADASGYIQETNEANNERTKRFAVHAPAYQSRTY